MSRSKQESYRIYGSPERQDFVRSLGCIVCGQEPQLCHSATGGMGRKADYTTIYPACHSHHAEQHQMGVKSFEAKYGLDLKAVAAHVEVMWQRKVSTS